MEKSYRDLYEALSHAAAGSAELTRLLEAVGEIDDLDPLRIPSLKAMKRIPPPPIGLSYAYENGKLGLFARNVVRKRRARKPTLCGELEAPAWLFDQNAPAPCASDLRARFVELVHRSFGYLETRIANYFEIICDRQLVIENTDEPVLAIRMLCEAALPAAANA